MALPRLLAEGLVADAAFVDGSHRFHEVFVDLYFLRKIVRPGGLIVLDDVWSPSVRTALRYYERNLGWTVIPEAFPREPGLRRRPSVILGPNRRLAAQPFACPTPRSSRPSRSSGRSDPPDRKSVGLSEGPLGSPLRVCG
ncbi:class I SAM-dependent methyltransferase [Streptomyces sp. NPDC092129]|uniref:class I SAM-dependent methyltransferase n=1 Tax=Streptomyces sp. NPDC092129 TaxID=3366010 RepID=UPI0038005ECA